MVDLSSTQPQDDDDDDNDKEKEDAVESEENDKQDGLQSLADGLVTLSLLPKSQPAQSQGVGGDLKCTTTPTIQ